MYVFLRLACCCSCVAVSSSAPLPAPPPEIAAHSTWPPVPRCAVECPGLQSAHWCMGRELGDEHGSHVLCTCSSIPRVAAPIASIHRFRRPSPRSEIVAHSARPPVPRCAVECPGLQSAHWCMGRELGDGHEWHVCCTCSSTPRVAAALASLCRRCPLPHPPPPPSRRTPHGRLSLAAL